MPGSLAARSSSCSASSGDCIGSIARPKKRCGYFACAAEAASLNACDSARPSAGLAQYTIGVVSESACTSTRRASIASTRASTSTKRSSKALTSFAVRMRYVAPSRSSEAPSRGPSFSNSRIHSAGYQWAWISMVFIGVIMPPCEEEDYMLFKTLAARLSAAAAPAAPQDAYPGKPVKIIVPYGPGGATDIIARIVGQRLTESLGQTFLVENRPGANGNIALEAAARAAPDGYTLFVGNVSTNTINENVFAKQLTIKPSRDLAGIAKLIDIPHVVVVNAAFAANSIAELIAAA